MALFDTAKFAKSQNTDVYWLIRKGNFAWFEQPRGNRSETPMKRAQFLI
jgi:hypothetical protein